MKVRYDLAEVKMAIFERDCSILYGYLNEVYSFLEEVKHSGSPAALVGRIIELEKLFEEKDRGV